MRDQVAYARARTGVAFPGQITQCRPIQAALAAHADHSLVGELFARLGITRASEIDVSSTRIAQPCTYVAGLVSAWRQAAGPAPVTLGHSLGEITALAYAGAIDPSAGLDLVFELGEVGHEQDGLRPAALVVLAGLDEADAEWICRHAAAETGSVLEPSGFNGPRQLVYSGDRKAAEVAAAMVGSPGFARLLDINGAYHSSLMTEVLPRWRRAVRSLTFRDPRTPVISAVDGRCRDSATGLADLLVRWLVLPVRWQRAVATAAECGVPALWDAGPGQVLAGIARRGSALEFVAAPEGEPR